MRKVTIRRPGALLATAIALALLPSAGQAAVAGSPARARITARPLPGQAISAPAVTGGLPSKKQQIKVLVAALARMRRNYAKLALPNPVRWTSWTTTLAHCGVGGSTAPAPR